MATVTTSLPAAIVRLGWAGVNGELMLTGVSTNIH